LNAYRMPIANMLTAVLIDDDDSYRSTVRVLLRGEVDVLEAASIHEGIRLVGNTQPDLVLLDQHFRLSRRTGSSAVGELRAAAQHAAILLVSFDDGAREEAWKARCDGFIDKGQASWDGVRAAVVKAAERGRQVRLEQPRATQLEANVLSIVELLRERRAPAAIDASFDGLRRRERP
jgi:DNA-binding NarL/FixJ family response regulator